MAEPLNPQPTSGLSRNEKLGFIGLIVLAILVIYLGFRQLGNNIRGPLAWRQSAANGSVSEVLSEAEQLAALKQKDTDKDGLSDYDELYVYQTSPYLPDTDSDGISDKTEIEQGTDPNCPKGKDCAGGLTSPAAQKETATSTGEQPFAPTAQMPSVDQLLLQSLFGSNPDPKVLREFLAKQGMDKKTLEAFSDEELVQTMKEITSATSSLNIGQEMPTLPANLGGLSAKDLRQLLLNQGVSKEALDKISDEELMEMMKEIK